MFSITHLELLAYVGVLTLFQIILLIAWGVALPQVAQLVPIPNDAHVVQMCFNERWGIVAAVQYSFLVLVFIFTAIFAWRVRSIPQTEFKESKEIFLSVYNVGFVCVIAIPLASVFWYDPNASAAVTAAGTCFASGISVLVLFAAKFARVARGDRTSGASDATDQSSGYPSAFSLQPSSKSMSDSSMRL